LQKTEKQFREVIALCKSLFIKKNTDYGSSWRIMRLPSVTDQIYIKAARIRSIQDKGRQKVDDPIETEFIGIINYCIIALIQLSLEGKDEKIDLDSVILETMYDEAVNKNLELLMHKNHDYGEAWREMRISSITDIILMKIHRLKQIENNEGRTLVSEGIEANYRDMLNYAVFCLILGKERNQFIL
jgi:bifunctional pyridoxal-dependent enzyme with beta-cystathionase and maltose regulon repressor activities